MAAKRVFARNKADDWTRAEIFANAGPPAVMELTGCSGSVFQITTTTLEGAGVLTRGHVVPLTIASAHTIRSLGHSFNRGFCGNVAVVGQRRRHADPVTLH